MNINLTEEELIYKTPIIPSLNSDPNRRLNISLDQAPFEKIFHRTLDMITDQLTHRPWTDALEGIHDKVHSITCRQIESVLINQMIDLFPRKGK